MIEHRFHAHAAARRFGEQQGADSGWLRRRTIRAFPAAAALLLLSAPARADAECRGFIDPRGEIARASVRPGEKKAHFLAPASAQRPDCPSKAPGCALPGYLVAGDEALIERYASKGIVCVLYVSPKGVASSGLLPIDALTPPTNVLESLNDARTFGAWRSGPATITIRKAGGDGYVLVDGDTSRGPPSHNLGAISGPAFLGGSDDVAGYSDQHYGGEAPANAPFKPDDGCRVRFRSTGAYLIVDDNDRCGGGGVSFSGIYVKRAE